MSLKPPEDGPARRPAPREEAESFPDAPLTNIDTEDEAKLDRLAEMLPAEKRGEFYQVLRQTISHSGWLPPPRYLAEYESILPGLAERIVRLPEREQEHRHRFLNNESTRNYRIKRWGQHYALLGMLLLLGFSVFLTLMGEPVWAARVAIGTIAAVVGIFVTGKIADAKAARHEDE